MIRIRLAEVKIVFASLCLLCPIVTAAQVKNGYDVINADFDYSKNARHKKILCFSKLFFSGYLSGLFHIGISPTYLNIWTNFLCKYEVYWIFFVTITLRFINIKYVKKNTEGECSMNCYQCNSKEHQPKNKIRPEL